MKIWNKNSLTANLSGGIIEIASAVIPSICALTKADIAMSGRPAEGGEHKQHLTERVASWNLMQLSTTAQS